MKLSEEIISKWEETATDYYSPIDSMFALGYPAWVIRLDGGYGVAVPIESDIQVSECFSNAKLYTHTFELEKDLFQRALFLQTTSAEVEDPFASLCAEFIFPGEDGIFRHELEKDPVGWWAKWKELLGNKNVDDLAVVIAARAFYRLAENAKALFVKARQKHHDMQKPADRR